jgi:hypothetical protein
VGILESWGCEMSDVVVYNDGELELKVSVNEETIWLTQKQLVELFEVTKQNISLHINNIFKEDELNKNSTVKFFLTVQHDIYHIGASLKDLGKKWFAFSKMDMAIRKQTKDYFGTANLFGAFEHYDSPRQVTGSKTLSLL